MNHANLATAVMDRIFGDNGTISAIVEDLIIIPRIYPRAMLTIKRINGTKVWANIFMVHMDVCCSALSLRSQRLSLQSLNRCDVSSNSMLIHAHSRI